MANAHFLLSTGLIADADADADALCFTATLVPGSLGAVTIAAIAVGGLSLGLL